MYSFNTALVLCASAKKIVCCAQNGTCIASMARDSTGHPSEGRLDETFSYFKQGEMDKSVFLRHFLILFDMHPRARLAYTPRMDRAEETTHRHPKKSIQR